MRKITLNYSIKDSSQRLSIVNQIIDSSDKQTLTPKYLESLADYLLKGEENLLTENRLQTINKRESGGQVNEEIEPREFDRNQYLVPSLSITKQDLAEIPFLQQLRTEIDNWDRARKGRTGRDAYIMKKAVIEMRKDQYAIKQAFKPPIKLLSTPHERAPRPHLDLSFTDSKVIAAILANYSRLKQESKGNFRDDLWYFMEDFDALCARALELYPSLSTIVKLKIDGRGNAEIANTLDKIYSDSYISKLWKVRIPRIIADQAIAEERIREAMANGEIMKQCTKCLRILPATTQFYPPNTGVCDGLYSMCRKCRKEKYRCKK